MNLGTLIAFGPFASGWMLLWGFAATIPIIIHLWSKRRYREESWAAIEFLLAAMRNNARRIRIEQLILLTIRTLILVLLAVALADPLFSFVRGLGASVGGGQTHWVLVIDGSYSMDYRQEEKTRFELAQELATRVVRESTRGDGFTLVLMSEPPLVVVSQPVFDPDDVVDEIAGLRMRHRGANLSATLSEVDQLVSDAREKQPRLTQHQICFFTDLGQNTWDEATTDSCRRRVAGLQQRSALLLYDVGLQADNNLAITDLSVRQSVVTRQRDVLMEAAVRNFGSRGAEGRKIEFYSRGQRIAERTLSVRAGGQAVVTFSHRFESPGEHVIEARLDEDPIRVDNHRWLSVPVRQQINVLCIRGKPGAARHVALALNPATGEQARVHVDIESESAILESRLEQYACVFLCNVGRIGKDEADVLHEFVSAGGGLVVSLGDQVQPESYNTRFGGRPGGSLLPARLDELATTAQSHLDPLDYEHPIVAPFRGFDRSGLLTTPVWRYYRLVPVAALSPNVALGFDGGEPAIVESTVGRGRCVLIATALSNASYDKTTNPPTPWTAISTWPSFPPLVQEILEFAIRGIAEVRNVQVGEPIGDRVPQEAVNAQLIVSGPHSIGGAGGRVNVLDAGEYSDWAFDQTWWSGAYEAKFAAPASVTQFFAANVDTSESSLDRFDSELLPSQIQRTLEGQTAETAVIPATGQSKYFRLFLGMVLMLLIVETIYAWYIGGAR